VNSAYGILATAVFLLASCGEESELGERLERLASRNIGGAVDISVATPFAWDEVAVFGPYYPKPNACKVLGLSRWSCFWLRYPEPDDSSPSLIAFLKTGEVVSTALLKRCTVEVVLRDGFRTDRGSARFSSSIVEKRCSPGVPRLTQE